MLSPAPAFATATVAGRAWPCLCLEVKAFSSVAGGAAGVPTDISLPPVGAQVNAVVCGRTRRTGLQNILELGTAPHTSWLIEWGWVTTAYHDEDKLVNLFALQILIATAVLHGVTSGDVRYAGRLSRDEMSVSMVPALLRVTKPRRKPQSPATRQT